ncbi:unnamed protein product [Rotaria magnacalcarata]|uniref:Uncharacterized protein n=1 Tax=Rotaria magnacalcarata TaxID=392030 RepID=A0A816UNF8_9BILA|nr:unnamed protein product [Rotaria magnacalcarata]
MFSIQPNASSRTGKKSTDDIKRRLQSVLGYSPHAIYFGFIPLVIYLGFKLGPDPGTPEFSLINLLPIEPKSEIQICKDAKWSTSRIVAGGRSGALFDLTRLLYPLDLIFDGKQDIYVADMNNHRIVKWSHNTTIGSLVAGSRGAGTRLDQLNRPSGVLLNNDGDLIICDSGNRRIQLWSRNILSGETLIGYVDCRQIFFDEPGDLLFTTNKNEIFQFTWQGNKNVTTFMRKAGGKFPPKSASNMCLSRTGNLYVADSGNNRILKYTLGNDDMDVVAGGQEWQSSDLAHLTGPASVIVDDKGALYISENGNNRLVRWTVGAKEGVVIGGKKAELC